MIGRAARQRRREPGARVALAPLTDSPYRPPPPSSPSLQAARARAGRRTRARSVDAQGRERGGGGRCYRPCVLDLRACGLSHRRLPIDAYSPPPPPLNLPQVRIAQAFDSSATLAEAVAFLRKYGEDQGCHAAAAVIPKSCVAYPQVWLKEAAKKVFKRGWPEDGFFLQLEAPRGLRRLWFVPAGGKPGAYVPEPAVLLDIDFFQLLPQLFAS